MKPNHNVFIVETEHKTLDWKLNDTKQSLKYSLKFCEVSETNILTKPSCFLFTKTAQSYHTNCLFLIKIFLKNYY